MAQDVLALAPVLTAPVSWAAVRHYTARKNAHQRTVLPNLQGKNLNPMNPLGVPLLVGFRSVEIHASCARQAGGHAR